MSDNRLGTAAVYSVVLGMTCMILSVYLLLAGHVALERVDILPLKGPGRLQPDSVQLEKSTRVYEDTSAHGIRMKFNIEPSPPLSEGRLLE